MIQINNLTTHAGEFTLNASLDLGAEYFVLLGMTGSGKTVFLECLCGLRQCEAGSVVINQHDITHAEPRDRNIGYVPQDGALFSHLTVNRNIEFGLTVRKVSKIQRRKQTESMAALLGISHLLHRKVTGLSGGERQRVALARALVLNPSMLVLDEPVSALDEFTRETVCRELIHIQRELKIPVLHVCHSFEETALIADRVGIMKAGQIVQTGTIAQVQSTPADTYVAKIFRHTNLFTGKADPAGITINDYVVKAPVESGIVDFLIRPWQVRLCNGLATPKEDNRLCGTIKELRSIGPMFNVSIDGRLPLSFFVTMADLQKRNMPLNIGCQIEVEFGPEAVHVFGGLE